MSRWRVVLVTLGSLALVAADQPASNTPNGQQDSTERERRIDTEQAASTIAGAIRETIRPIENDIGCQDRKDKRDSDLCAQWKAADAARDAANYACISLVIGILGTLAVVTTLHYTRKAVLASEKATKDADKALDIAAQNASAARRAASAASEANTIAKQNRHIELRPHVYLVRIEANRRPRSAFEQIDTDFVSSRLIIRNFGVTPAIDVSVYARSFIGGFWNGPVEGNLEGAARVPLANIPPNLDLPVEPYTVEYGIGVETLTITGGVASIFVEGQIQYRDMFGETHYTNFRQACSGEDLNSLIFRPCPDWNDAT